MPRYTETTVDNGVLTVVMVQPYLGMLESPAVAEDVLSAIDETDGLRAVVLDLSGVVFVNSYGVGMMIELRQRALARGGRTMAIGLTAELRSLFELMKLGRLVDLPADRDAIEELLKAA